MPRRPTVNKHPDELYEIIKLKKAAAEVLFNGGQYNNSAYLAGYVLEVAYKLAIDLANREYRWVHSYDDLASDWSMAVVMDPQLSRHTLFNRTSPDHPTKLGTWTEHTRYEPSWFANPTDVGDILAEVVRVWSVVGQMKADKASYFRV